MIFVATLIFVVLNPIDGQEFSPSASPCGVDFGGCHKEYGLCWGTSANTRYCTCKAGYREKSSYEEHTCVDIDECADGTVCPENSICENTNGGYNCHCHCGFIKDYTGEKCLDATLIQGICEVPTRCRSFYGMGPRASIPFGILPGVKYDYVTDTRSMQPIRDPENHMDSSESCECEAGFKRNPCGFCEDIDECEEGSHECVGEGAVCKNIEGNYYCNCQPGFTLCGRTCYGSPEKKPSSCDVPGDIKTENFAGDFPVSPVPQNSQMCERLKNSPPSVKKSNPFHVMICGDWVLEESPMPMPPVCEGLEKSSTSVLEQNRFHVKLCEELRRKNTGETKDEDSNGFIIEVGSWGGWTCWSACKPTCWGGLQTRTRICRNGVVGVECNGRASEARECYTGPKCPFRVRKDASTLSDREKIDLLQAMEKFKADTSATGFHNAGSSHGWPMQCDNQDCCPHGAKLKFVAWHRSTVLNYEKGLTRYLNDETLGLPYWNWLAPNRNPPSLAWNKELHGKSNPFANMTVRIDLDGPMRTIQRLDLVDSSLMDLAHDEWVQVSESLMRPNRMHEFSESLEDLHGYPHVAVCDSEQDVCDISMANLAFAGFDPVFMFHHTQIDRLWAVWQKNQEDSEETAWTIQTALERGEPLSDFARPQMPFGNSTINSFPILKAVNNMRDSYYYTQLTGVVYDSLANNGFPAAREAEGAIVFQELLIAHFLRNIEGSHPVYVNYYRATGETSCSRLTSDNRLGGNVMLPTGRIFKNSFPTLIYLTNPEEVSADDDINIKTCYTNKAKCVSKCEEARNPGLDKMPNPGLLQRNQNDELEVYKFDWSPGNFMPKWTIFFETKSTFIYFYGTRAQHVYQVRTRKEWKECDLKNAKRFHCPEKTPCILPSGTYYLVDHDPQLCLSGLRMIALSQV